MRNRELILQSIILISF